MRGESGPLKPGPGSGGDPRLGGPSQGRAAVTHPRPIAHTPPAASLAALAAKPRRRGPGGWGGTGGRRAAAPEGSGQRRGMGRAPGASRRPCPLQEPFRSVTWDPDPRERRLDKRVWWPQREACGILGARGEAPRASQPSLAARPSAAGEMRVAGASAEAKWEPLGRGRGAVRRREGEGGCHTPLFSLESGSGGGRPGKCLFVGPGNIQGLAQGPRN